LIAKANWNFSHKCTKYKYSGMWSRHETIRIVDLAWLKMIFSFRVLVALAVSWRSNEFRLSARPILLIKGNTCHTPSVTTTQENADDCTDPVAALHSESRFIERRNADVHGIITNQPSYHNLT
jgi:hypothetical protein